MGVGKTLQGIADELAEREEVAAGGRWVIFFFFSFCYIRDRVLPTGEKSSTG